LYISHAPALIFSTNFKLLSAQYNAAFFKYEEIKYKKGVFKYNSSFAAIWLSEFSFKKLTDVKSAIKSLSPFLKEFFGKSALKRELKSSYLLSKKKLDKAHARFYTRHKSYLCLKLRQNYIYQAAQLYNHLHSYIFQNGF